jgi:hypothetical protein
MRLLSLPVTIVRLPIELGFGAAKQAVKLAQGLVGGGEETAVEEPARTREPAPRRKPSRRSTNGRSGTAATRTSRSRTSRSRAGSRASESRTTASATAPQAEPVAERPPRSAGGAATEERSPRGTAAGGAVTEERLPAGTAAGGAVAGERPPAPASSAPTEVPAGAPAFGEPAPAEPAHVSEEPELVVETAEAGAEDGAGAEVAVDEPWPGYDEMQAADIEDRLVAEGAEAAAAVSLYEASRKGRAAVLEAASRQMS